jgi:hypothetical protein
MVSPGIHRKRMTEAVQQSNPTPPAPIPGLDWRFLQRTAIAALMVTVLIALTGAAYFTPAWGGRYVVCSLWTLIFFSFTAYIFKYLLFEGKKLKGACFILLKVVWLGLFLVFAAVWPFNRENAMADKVAILLGVSTPLAVLALRGVGFMIVNREKFQSTAPPTPGNERFDRSDPKNGAIKSIL